MENVRIGLTVVFFVVFVGIVIWAFSRRRKREFEDAANLPFSGHDFGEPTSSTKKNGGSKS